MKPQVIQANPELLTKKRVLVQVYNEFIDLVTRQELDLEMNKTLILSETDPKMASEREKKITEISMQVENNTKFLDIITRKFIEEVEKDKTGKKGAKEENGN